jgi:DNA-binding response OmpR family regulator
MPQPKILVVEDEDSLRETLQYNLAKQGYEVLTTASGIEAVDLARSAKPDVIILDIMLPGQDGFEVCRIVRRESSVPIMMLTARTEEIDKVVGLEIGADDYMTKPFSMREMLARVKALLRRVRLIEEEIADKVQESGNEAGIAEATAPPLARAPVPALSFGDLVIDVDRREAMLRGQALNLKPKEFDLLLFLARHPGMVLSRDLILERVWGWSYGGGSRTVDVHVRWLREKLEADPANPTRILTARGVGYRFER